MRDVPSKITLAVCFLLAMAFTFSCSSGGGGGGGGGDDDSSSAGNAISSSSDAIVGSSSSDAIVGSSSSDNVVSSSSAGNAISSSSNAIVSSSSVNNVASSSSVSVSSSSNGSTADCTGFVNGTTREHYGKQKKQFCDSRDGKKYVYVEIGTQAWMAENLNYDVPDDATECYGNIKTNCDTYGRRYKWTTAMGGSASSNANPSGVQGVCPVGWHLPSEEEWIVLIDFATDDEDLNEGTRLKVAPGTKWDPGTDNFGFSALNPGLIWWTATLYRSSLAIVRHVANPEMGWDAFYKEDPVGYVRCVHDSSVQPSSSSTIPPSSSSIGAGATFIDARDNTEYKWVTIGTQTWMAENLKFNASGSKCAIYEFDTDFRLVNDNTPFCDKYGRLYDWSTAMGIDAKYNKLSWGGSDVKQQGVCPSGWHLPSYAELWDLIKAVGGESTAGEHLKSKKGWYNCGPSGSSKYYSCEDTYGFSALPGSMGFFYSDDDYRFDVRGAGTSGSWWSASESEGAIVSESGTIISRFSHGMGMKYGNESTYPSSGGDRRALLSVRCLKD